MDDLEAAGFKTFGPRKDAARLEGSKGFTKDLCRAHNIPTGAYERFTAAEPAKAYARRQTTPIVIKADGLAAGKGVIIAETIAEAEAAIDMMFGGGLGDAGAEVVIEEFLVGEEASFFALCDGETAIPLASAQDHKRAFDNDQGPNTGGMGAYSPAPVMTAEITRRTMDEIVLPTVAAMRQMGAPFKGILFAGLMITAQGPKLIEYNTRFGDPECQVMMLRLMSDLVPALIASRDGQLKNFDLRWYDEAALVVVMATNGYPGQLRQGLGDRRPRRRGRARGRADLPCRHQGGRRSHHGEWRARARRRGHGAVGARGAEPRLRGGGQDRLAGRVLPAGYRVSGVRREKDHDPGLVKTSSRNLSPKKAGHPDCRPRN